MSNLQRFKKWIQKVKLQGNVEKRALEKSTRKRHYKSTVIVPPNKYYDYAFIFIFEY